MTGFVEQTQHALEAETLPWLKEFKATQASAWKDVAFPHRKSEHWKYTSLKSLENGNFFTGTAQATSIDDGVRDQLAINGLESIDLVFVNGVFNAEYSTPSDQFSDGLHLVNFSQANDAEQALISAQLNAVEKSEQHLFATLNNSLLGEGVLMRVSKNTSLEKPVRIVQLSTAQETSFTVSPRLLVVLEEGARACVIEHFCSDAKPQTSFVNAVTEFDVQANAHLEHYRLHLEDESNLHIGGVHANLQRDANLESFYLALGSKLKRIDLVVNHLGKGSNSNINGVYVPCNNQHVDFHTCIEHAVPHCTSTEVFRGIISDNAKAVFNGRIHIHKDAQKTLAQLSNKNLLTSNKAEIDTKPELEIYADDVQCAHGATVAQLDDNAMHYLMTRGVSKEEAKVMMSFGFINELINQIGLEPIAAYVRPKLATLFARDEELLRHIV